MTLKLKLMSLLALGVIAMSACEKDPVIDDPLCRNKKPKDPVICPVDPCGDQNGILPGGCVRYQDDFNVVFLPLQCEGGNSTETGLEKDGKFYAVRCDRSGLWGSYRPGDKISIEYWFTEDCVFAASCSTPWADGCIAIGSIDTDYTK